MRARSTRSGHTLVRRLILVSFLLFPWPVLAEEGAALPLSKIMLYSSGVGYFQHDGTVNNRTQLDLRMQANQINDMLKSLVVQDFGGGRISTVTYGSHDPVTKTLGSFGINLNGNPTLGQILTQVRGEPVEVTAPNPIAGTLLGVEKKTESDRRGLAAPRHRAGICHAPDRRRVPLTFAGERAAHQIDQSRVECRTAPGIGRTRDESRCAEEDSLDYVRRRREPPSSCRISDGNSGLENHLSTRLRRRQGALSARLGYCGKSDFTGLAQRETLSCLGTAYLLHDGSVSTTL